MLIYKPGNIFILFLNLQPIEIVSLYSLNYYITTYANTTINTKKTSKIACLVFKTNKNLLNTAKQTSD